MGFGGGGSLSRGGFGRGSGRGSGATPPASARSGSLKSNPKKALLEWAQSRIGYDIADIKVGVRDESRLK